MGEVKMEYIMIDKNTYETYNSSTKMKTILKFAEITDEEQKRIDDFIIDILSNVYLKRIIKEFDERARNRVSEILDENP